MIRSGTPWDMGGAHPETRGRREPQQQLQQLGGRKGRCLELPGFASLSGRGWDTRVCCSQGLRSPGPRVGFGFPLKTAVSINRRISPCSPNPFSHPIIRRVLEIPRPVTRRPEAGGLMAWVWPGFWDLYTTARALTGRQIWDPCLRPPQTGLALGRGKGRDAVCGRLGPPGSQQGPPAGLQCRVRPRILPDGGCGRAQVIRAVCWPRPSPAPVPPWPSVPARIARPLTLDGCRLQL